MKERATASRRDDVERAFGLLADPVSRKYSEVCAVNFYTRCVACIRLLVDDGFMHSSTDTK